MDVTRLSAWQLQQDKEHVADLLKTLRHPNRQQGHTYLVAIDAEIARRAAIGQTT